MNALIALFVGLSCGVVSGTIGYYFRAPLLLTALGGGLAAALILMLIQVPQ